MTPTVSIIVPCYNEEATIGFLLEAIAHQSYPSTDLEIVIADGLSTDRTRQTISDFQNKFPNMEITVVENKQRSIPSGLNQAIAAARGDYIIRLDAHSIPQENYVERCVKALTDHRGDNIGGKWEIQAGSKSWIAQSIAVAAAHPLGVGDAHYRLGGIAQVVDTVPFGAYRRTLIQAIGGYDEGLLTNEDYELNVRIRNAGGSVWFDPQIRSTYIARANLGALARQYWRYGYWKARMLRRYPNTIRWRQFLPPVFVFALLLLTLGSLYIPIARFGLACMLGIYTTVLFLAGISAAFKYHKLPLALGLPLAIATMHLSWGAAFLWSSITR